MLLLIDNYDSFTFNLYQYLSELGSEVEVHRNDEITVEDCLAMGADKAVLINDPLLENTDSNARALALSKAIGNGGYDLVICGKQAIDLDDAQTDLETHQLSREIHALLADQRAHLYLWELDWWSAWRPGIEHQVISPGDYFGDLSAWRIP